MVELKNVLPEFPIRVMRLQSQNVEAILEEVMDYRTYCCASAKPSAKPTAALVSAEPKR